MKFHHILFTLSAVSMLPNVVLAASDFDKDRAAILAMAGSYEVGFSFQETYAVRPGYSLKPPYYAGAHELVTVVKDTPEEIVLQHVLVVCEEKKAEESDTDNKAFTSRTITECRPIKHWRQDWAYEDRKLMVFKGDNTWEWQTISKDEARGAWTQAVYQVDDGPRYEAHGHWSHEANQSVWESQPTWRPLPRREYTKRDDYDVLVAINRHVITPDGWIHEQDNYKLDLHRNTEHPVIARERGFNSYERNDSLDLSLAIQYWDQTHDYWAKVRETWDDFFQQEERFVIQAKVGDKPRYKEFFDLALNEGVNTQQQTQRLQAILDEFSSQP